MAYPIIDETAGALLIADGRLYHVEDGEARPFFLPTDETMYYEVVRVRDGVPLFWEDHATRLLHSVAGAFPLDLLRLRKDADRLLAAADARRCNIRIVVTARHTVLHLSPYYYPSDTMVTEGVACSVLSWERETPQVKTVREDYKRAVSAAFAIEGPGGRPFEVLLADRSGQLTEGSRSNLFFVHGNTVFSAPDDCILLGITRRHVQRAVAEAGFAMETRTFSMEELRAGAASAAFLTGSPIDVLPIARIDTLELDPENAVVRAVREHYLEILDEYVRHASLLRDACADR